MKKIINSFKKDKKFSYNKIQLVNENIEFDFGVNGKVIFSVKENFRFIEDEKRYTYTLFYNRFKWNHGATVFYTGEILHTIQSDYTITEEQLDDFKIALRKFNKRIGLIVAQRKAMF